MTMSTALQNKLLQYAPEPPAKTWEAIAKALDEAPITSDFAQSLYQYEETPPVSAWSRISTELDNSSPAKVIPFYKRNRRALQYVAAAVILFAFVLGAGLLVNRSARPELNHTNAAVNIPVDTESKRSLPGNNAAVAVEQAPVSSFQNHEPIAAIHRESRNITNRIRSHMQLGNVLLAANFIPKTAERKQTVSRDPSLDKYMVYSDNDGNAMKLPKKLFDFITCVREDMLCKEQMQQLQEKLASTSLNTDFTGVLEILNNLKENQ
ncbi:MAG TPA: hypothetical protein VJ499_12180 [Flavisolibacter sp.]|nr:hypothetical protein [Flavisolibacter sp.]